jgi:tetratricopeptide (TPR) repeat protein
MVVLKANYQDRIELHRDEPLALTVSLTNPDAIHASSHNIAIDSRLELLKRKLEAGEVGQEGYEKERRSLEEQKILAEAPSLGAQNRPWFKLISLFRIIDGESKQLAWPLHLLSYFPSTAIATLDGSTTCLVEFGLDPDDIGKIEPGKYRIRAVVEKVSSEKETGIRSFESNAVEIDVLATKLSEDAGEKEGYLTTVATYYLKRGTLARASVIVEKILARDTHSLDGLTLLGQINEAKGDYKAALETYRKAVDEFYLQQPDDYEGPRYLVSQILRLGHLVERQ